MAVKHAHLFPLLLQLRDSAGLRPAFPIVPLASELWGTSTIAIGCCVQSIT
jgi:hypothetical protein